MIRLPKSKYRNKKTVVDGITFDSKLEAEYYLHLKLMLKFKKILGFEMQKKVLLQDGYARPSTGTKVRPIFYVVDFLVYENNGDKTYVDVKGMKTDVFKLKQKLFEYKFKLPLKTVKKSGKTWIYD